jgi:hypothetical protein
MTIVRADADIFRFPNTLGALPTLSGGAGYFIASMGTMDAATEKIAAIGSVHWYGRPASTKTLSSAGGKIHFRTGSVTWATAGTTLRVGIQDLQGDGSGASVAQPDGTFDVYDDLVQGTDALSANAFVTATMSSGTKSIAHGQLLAVVFDLTVRNGADSIIMMALTAQTKGFSPCHNNYVGSWAATATGNCPIILLEADDGTLGIFAGCLFGVSASTSLSSSTTPDEIALVFQVPWEIEIGSLWTGIAPDLATHDWRLRLYSNPLGTPTALATVDGYGEQGTGDTDERWGGFSIAPQVIRPNIDYAIAIAGTGSAAFGLAQLSIADAAHRAVMGLSNCRQGSRSDDTGAFGSLDTTLIPALGFGVSGIHSGQPRPQYHLGI